MAIEQRHLALPRGISETEPSRTPLQRALVEEWFDTCALFGFQAVQVPAIGFADTFTRGHHATGDRIYQFPDRRGRELALVSDSLPAVLRFASTRRHPEQRLSYSCPIFRYERRPRRHFHHLGLMEVHDRPGTMAAQVRSTLRITQVLHEFLRNQLSVSFTITDPGLWHILAGLFRPAEKTAEYLNLLRHIPVHDRAQRLRSDGAPDPVVQMADLLAVDPALTSWSDLLPVGGSWDGLRDRVAACHQVAQALRMEGAHASTDLTELHASEFHDGPSFLLRAGGGRVLGDGGSYGRFAQAFLPTPARIYAGIIGLERLADLIAGDEIAHPAADLAILATQGVATQQCADRLAVSLRSASVSVWDTVLNRPTRQHLRDLAALAIPYSIIVGERELRATEYRVRDCSGTLHLVAHAELAQWLTKRRS